MALKSCRECGNQISSSARACPMCGKRSSGILRLFKWACGGVIFIILAIVAAGVAANNGSPATPCHSNWQRCTDNTDLMNNYGSIWSITKDCQRAAENSAKYGTPKFPYSSFGSYLKGSDYIATGKLILVEDDAQFQNAFGAMVHSTVKCEYDMNSNSVGNVDIMPN